MRPLALATLLCVIVTSISRSVPITESLDVTIDNITDVIKQINVDLDFDSGEFSEFLRCSACLVECVQIQKQESYFLCKKCLESCASQTDVFMHFFSSHHCTVTSQKTTATRYPEQIPSLSKPKSASGSEYLDGYMEKQYFSDKCDVTEQQFKDMQKELSSCKTQLGNCDSGWPTDSEYEEYPDYSSTNDHSSYPGATSNGLDDERSADPPTTSQTTTFEALGRFGSTFAALTKYVRNNPSNETNLVDENIDIRNFTYEEITAIVEKFESMFVTKQQYEKLMAITWGENQVLLKSTSNSQGMRQAACATRQAVHSPVQAWHKSGKFPVQVVQADLQRQPFIFAECASKIPSYEGLPTHAECRTVPVQRSAVILVDEKNIDDFKDCVQIEGKHICRDWINVAGACSLFL